MSCITLLQFSLWDTVGLCLMDNHSSPTNNRLLRVIVYSESHVAQRLVMSDGGVHYGAEQGVAQ
jgi:hypothetical protein